MCFAISTAGCYVDLEPLVLLPLDEPAIAVSSRAAQRSKQVAQVKSV